MIICYYPGAGGNRYYRMLQNLDWIQPNQTYDDLVKDQIFQHRYLYHESVVDQQPVMLTHCMNTPLIKKLCPGQKITVILADLQSCLRREWSLSGHQRYQQKSTPRVDDLELYNAVKDPSWPMITSADQLIELPFSVKNEFDQFRHTQQQKLLPVKDPLARLQKEYHDRISSAWDIIAWHFDYYTQYPLDAGHSDNVIDIQDTTEFASIMRQELEIHSSEIFDRCWAELS